MQQLWPAAAADRKPSPMGANPDLRQCDRLQGATRTGRNTTSWMEPCQPVMVSMSGLGITRCHFDNQDPHRHQLIAPLPDPRPKRTLLGK